MVLQPSYFPWLGYLDQYAWADDFVIYDDVQFDKNGWRNRNRILGAQGPLWLTVPVRTKGQEFPLIKDVQIDNQANPKWRHKQLESIRQSYSKAPYFGEVFELCQKVLSTEWNSLLELNLFSLRQFTDYLGLPWKVILSSEMEVSGRKTDRLVGICETLHATDYLTGDAAREYLQQSAFDEIGVQVHWHAYEHPTYPQKRGGGEFVPYLSIVDLLFSCGPHSLGILASPRTRQRLAAEPSEVRS